MCILKNHLQAHRDPGVFRGYGFLSVPDEAVVKQIISQEHEIDGHLVPAPMLAKSNNFSGKGISRGGGNGQLRNQRYQNASNMNQAGGTFTRPSSAFCKVFVGGLSHQLTEQAFRDFFEQFGPLADSVIMYDYVTSRPRGFGFVTFANPESASRLLRSKFYELNGRRIEVKFAVSREKIRKARDDLNSLSSDTVGFMPMLGNEGVDLLMHK